MEGERKLFNKNVIEYTLLFLKMEISHRYTASYIGKYWLFLHPVVLILIYFFVFSKLVQMKLPGMTVENGYILYLLSGIIPWFSFAGAISKSPSLYIDNRNFITKINFPLISINISAVISESFLFILSFPIIIIISAFYKQISPLALVVYILIFALQQIFTLSLMTVLSILSVFIRDLKDIVPIVVQITFWLTPIVYTDDILPEYIKFFNPVFYFIDAYHKLMVFDSLDIQWNVFYILLLTLLSLAASGFMYKRSINFIREFV